ncbi:MAG: B12-binding domain-containing radical SAM protein [Aeromicrobium sp.]|nr:B12-binding domain-containing radical SAM protein [Aeromicrobium sp.]
MRIKMVLPALAEATDPFFRPIKYSLFPPLGLATLAGHCADDDEITIEDEHVGPIRTDDEPDVVVIETYITSARRAYELADLYRARGAHVCIGGLHPTSLPLEAAEHADSIFLGPGDDSWPRFLGDYRAGHPKRVYRAERRSLLGLPRPRRDLIDRGRYLVPNSIVVSRGCPHSCDFCYKEAFYAGGRSFYTMQVDDALGEIDSLAGRHLYFLDDNLFADDRFARSLMAGLRGSGRVWQAAGTVEAVLRPGLVEAAAGAGLRSLFVGFETLDQTALAEQGKGHNVGRDYDEAVRRLHDAGIMVNASFVFGMDHHTPDVFERTAEWAISRGIETATFHVLTPYPGTALYARLEHEGRILTRDWDRYDTRHCVISHPTMTPAEIEAGYHRARRMFYSWKGIASASLARETMAERVRHFAYSAAWKKAGPVWDAAIALGLLPYTRPALETVLDGTRRVRRALGLAEARSA